MPLCNFLVAVGFAASYMVPWYAITHDCATRGVPHAANLKWFATTGILPVPLRDECWAARALKFLLTAVLVGDWLP